MATTTCIACSEDIKVGAKLCKHCGTKQDDPVYTGVVDVVDPSSTSPSEPATTDSADPSPTGSRLSKKAWIAIGAGAAVILASGGALAYTLWPEADTQALAMPGVGEQVARTSLAEGMCPNGTPERPVTEYDTLPVVDCDTEHLEEVFATVVSSDIDAWDQEALRAFGETTCATEFVERTGEQASESSLSFSFYLPSQDDWDAGYRAVACTLFDPRGPMTGPAPRAPVVVEATAEESESADEDLEQAEDSEDQQATPAPQAPATRAPQAPAPANPAADVQAERDRLLGEIQERNERIDDLAQEKRALVSQYEATYGPYSPNGPLYLNGNANDEIDLKQQIDDVETEIVNLEADVLILFGELNALPAP